MRYGIGMRYWLAIAFGAITTVTAVAVVQILSARTESAFRQHAEEIALGNAVRATGPIRGALRTGELQATVDRLAEERRMAMFVLSGGGVPETKPTSQGVEYRALPGRLDALLTAVTGETVTRSFGDGRATLVAIPLSDFPPRILMGYARSPEIAAGLGIAQEKITQTALLAAVLGGLAGLVVAVLITARLRRIATAAAAIESGDFDRELTPGFRDELGALGQTIDRMRVRLRDSFAVLEAERDRLHLLLERLHEGVLTVDADLNVEYANSSARRMLLLEDSTLPDPWPGFSLRKLAARLFDANAEPVHDRVAADADHAYAIVGVPAGAEGTAAVLVVTDVTERERRERAQREFVANAAHELRTPLSVITGAVEVLQAGAKDVPEERDRFLGHIARESARLGRLARALLMLARAQTRAETLRLERVELRPLLEQVAARVRAQGDVAVRITCPRSLAVAAQPELAEQIVSNLVDNASKLTEHGRILLRARSAPGGRVAIEVSDTGPGIDPADQEAVFERFSRGSDRRDREGFGLGLAIVRQAVRALGGRVELESSPGAGTTVRVVLPSAEARVLQKT